MTEQEKPTEQEVKEHIEKKLEEAGYVIPEPEEKKTYKLEVSCDNCDHSDFVMVPFGTVFQEASDQVHSTVACNNCGCHRLSKSKRMGNPYEPFKVKY